jgi:hypothetical protein
LTLPSDQLGTVNVPNAVCSSQFQRTIRSSTLKPTLPVMRSSPYAV